MTTPTPMQQLLNTLPQQGRLEWIGVRPARNEPMMVIDEAEVSIGNGITGDRFKGKARSKRQVTLIQQEHLPVIASLAHLDDVSASMLRRNLVVSGINLLALKDKTFQVGDVVLQYTGLCHPCSKMERLLGAGGYNAMRGHGGITASVIKGGVIRVNDKVCSLSDACQ